MICIFLNDKVRLSWSESQLRWLDPLVTCVVFYWVDLPMLAFPLEENSSEIEYSSFFSPFFFSNCQLQTHHWKTHQIEHCLPRKRLYLDRHHSTHFWKTTLTTYTKNLARMPLRYKRSKKYTDSILCINIYSLIKHDFSMALLKNEQYFP